MKHWQAHGPGVDVHAALECELIVVELTFDSVAESHFGEDPGHREMVFVSPAGSCGYAGGSEAVAVMERGAGDVGQAFEPMVDADNDGVFGFGIAHGQGTAIGFEGEADAIDAKVVVVYGVGE